VKTTEDDRARQSGRTAVARISRGTDTYDSRRACLSQQARRARACALMRMHMSHVQWSSSSMSDAVLWQWGGQQDNHALLRSARVPLPPVFGSGSACVSGAEQIAAPAGATAEVLRSHMVKPSCVPPSVFDELQEDAAKLLRDLLVEHPEEMPIISMMGNWPRPQVPPPPRPCPSPTLLALALPSWPWRSPASPPDPSPLSSRLVPLLSLRAAFTTSWTTGHTLLYPAVVQG